MTPTPAAPRPKAAAIEPVRLIRLLGRELWMATRQRGMDRVYRRLHERMSTPRVGDLVVETGGFGSEDGGVGVLLDIDDDRYTVEPLARPGGREQWRHATFVAVPIQTLRVWLDDTP
jgi:hypothetical protein